VGFAANDAAMAAILFDRGLEFYEVSYSPPHEFAGGYRPIPAASIIRRGLAIRTTRVFFFFRI